MADSSEREELEKLIENWNASRLDMFTISKPDAVSLLLFTFYFSRLQHQIVVKFNDICIKLHQCLTIPFRIWTFRAICGSIFKSPVRKIQKFQRRFFV